MSILSNLFPIKFNFQIHFISSHIVPLLNIVLFYVYVIMCSTNLELNFVQVLWYRDTMQLDTTERRIMESRGSRHTLIIRKVHPTDFGNYTCVADNQLGKTRKSIQLTGKQIVWRYWPQRFRDTHILVLLPTTALRVKYICMKT